MYKMVKDKKTKIGNTTFTTAKTPYANEKAPYSAQRADKKSKLPRPEIRAFG